MPLARHERLVSGVAEQFRQRHHPVVQIPLIAGGASEIRCGHLEHGADSGDVVIGSGQQHRARRRAGRGGMEIGQPDARVGQAVQVGSVDLTTEGADVREPEIVGHDDQKVGACHAQASCHAPKRCD